MKTRIASWPALPAHRRASVLLALLLALLLAHEAAGQERQVYADAPIRDVIDDIQQTSAYRFLYRDALITGKTVSFEADADGLIDALDQALRAYRLELQVDPARRQILLAPAPAPASETTPTLTGQVIDDASGARLPFATITWAQQGRLRGVAANEAGHFYLPLDDALARLNHLDLTASYVGYQPRQIRVDLRAAPRDIPIRLTIQDMFGHEVVVSSTVLHSEIDTTWRHLIQPGIFSPLGESNVLRSLQTLPAVSLSAALSQGLNVRGSKADGFQVLLDGVPIYSQNHFFGLFDAFNEDALQTVGFYYGVAPAYFEAPPGGTLSFVTRTGSQTHARKTVGLSNTAVKGTLEGPLLAGRGSWLLSGRHSYLNAVNWFNNAGLIAQGLDVGRETSAPRGADRFALIPGASSARFYDLHGKLYQESDNGRRLTFNVYLGGDHTRQEAERFLPGRGPGPNAEHVELLTVDTRNTWGNEAASLHDQRPLGSTRYGHSLLAFSRYHSRFAKDDFIYTRPLPRNALPPTPPEPDAPPRQFVDAFTLENDLFEVKAQQHIDGALRDGGVWSAGYALHHFDITYQEQSAIRPSYDETRRSTQLDLFAQYDRKDVRGVALRVGLRSHYFSQGRFLRLSPRAQVQFGAQQPVSLSLGYSRNHQFLHRLYLENTTSTDVWIMSTEDQPPGSVDNLTAGVYVKARPALFVQAEAYYKSYRNLRQHEVSAARQSVREDSFLMAPWLHDNVGRARGLEVMVRHRLGRLLWTHSYTLSKMEIRNDALNEGAYFLADWDRRHQFTSHLQGALSQHLDWRLTWVYASGAPNALAYAEPDEPTLLPDYHRMDASLRYRRVFGGVTLEGTASVFNLYDRRNTWYRTPATIVSGPQPNRRIDFVNVDVYDLGLQPSFELSFTF